MTLKHRDRILMALHHEESDRCPMQISFTPEFAKRLSDDIGSTRISHHNPHGGGNTYELETYLDEDMLITSVCWANSYYQDNKNYTDEWGIDWHLIEYETKFGKGRYTETLNHPLTDDSSVSSYVPPDPNRPELYIEAQHLIKEYKDEYWIVGAVVTTIFETAWALRGLEHMLMDFLINPEMVHRIFDIPYNYHLAAAKRLVELGVDMIWLGDDVGTQKAMFISPAQWREFLKPKMTTMVRTLKKINPQLKIAYHSDGNVYPIIPELIEIGIDVLNPIQPATMDPVKIKKEFGGKLCLWGTIDEQYTLPFGSPADVRREVKNRIKTVGKGGGLILGPTHHVQLDTPMENFWAMVETITGKPH